MWSGQRYAQYMTDRTEQLKIRTTPDTRDILERVAAHYGMSLSGAANYLIRVGAPHSGVPGLQTPDQR